MTTTHDDKAREREQFEEWASDYGLFPRAVERNAEGSYKLMKTATDWITWQAARAALSPASTGQEPVDIAIGAFDAYHDDQVVYAGSIRRAIREAFAEKEKA